MSHLAVSDTLILGLKVIERQKIMDSRGYFSRIFCMQELALAGWNKPVAQINQTQTQAKGSVRGMHFQNPPHGEIKFVTCIRGRIWDVAVDLREGSPTFLKWHAEELSESNNRAMLIPEGFAHGFQTLSDDCELIYLHSSAYCKEAEAGLNPIDPLLSVRWPLSIAEISAKDRLHTMLKKEYKGVKL